VLVVDADAGSNGDVTCVISSPYFTLQVSYVIARAIVIYFPFEALLAYTGIKPKKSYDCSRHSGMNTIWW